MKKLLLLTALLFNTAFAQLPFDDYIDIWEGGTNAGTVQDAIDNLTELPSRAINKILKWTSVNVEWSADLILSTLGIDHIDFNTSYTPPSEPEGRVWFDSTETALNMATGRGPVAQIPYEDWTTVFNDTGSTIPDGSTMYPVGAVNGVPSVALANSATHVKILGQVLLATEDIADQDTGIATTRGKVRNIDTSSFNQGDTVWVSDQSDGGITNIMPTFPGYAIQIGGVNTVGVTDGVIQTSIKGDPIDTIQNYHNGTFREKFQFIVTESGGVLIGTLTPTNGHPDMTAVFSTGFTIIDTDPGATVVLTAGTDALPQEQFVFITEDNPVLDISLSDFPYEEEHIKIAHLSLQSAATVALEGERRNQFINDFIQEDIGQGGKSRENDRMRQEPAVVKSGLEGGATIISASSPDDVYLTVTSGIIYQMGRHIADAMDLQVGPDLIVFNDSVSANTLIDNHNLVTLDSTGSSLSNRYFSTYLFIIQNSGPVANQWGINLPSGSYLSASSAIQDASNFSNPNPPIDLKGVIVPVARYTWHLSSAGSGTWTLEDVDNNVKGGVIGGGGGGGTGVTSFTGLTDTPSSYVGEALKIPQVSAGETGLEFTDSPQFVDLTVSNDLTVGGDFLLSGNIDPGPLKIGASTDTIDQILRFQNTNGPGDLTFTAAGDFYINNNVGIGIASPASLLHLYQDNTLAGIGAGLTIEQDGTGDSVLQYLLTNDKRWVTGVDNDDSNKFKFATTAGLGSDTVLTIDVNGSVGIGDASPSAALDVKGSGNGTVALFQRNNGFDNTQIRIDDPVASSDWLLTAGNNKFQIVESGVSTHISISDGGNVGIGTATPDTGLHVLAPFDADDSTLKLQSSDQDNTGISMWVRPAGATASNRNWQIVANSQAFGNLDILRSTDSTSAAATHVASFDSDGNMGIGTTDPLARLELHDDTFFIKFQETDGTADKSRYSFAASDDKFQIGARLDDDTFVRNIMVLEHDGNVGIGIASPDGTLHVHTATAGTVVANSIANDLVIENDADGGLSILVPDASESFIGLGTKTDNFGAAIAWDFTTDLMRIYTANTGGELSLRSDNNVEAIRIDSSQNVGIGTSTPSDTLEVDGEVLVTGVVRIFDDGGSRSTIQSEGGNLVLNADLDGSDDILFGFDANSGLGMDDFIFYKIQTVVHRLNDDSSFAFDVPNNGLVGDGAGNVGIGTASPDYLTHINGSSGIAGTANTLFGIDDDGGLAIQMGIDDANDYAWIRAAQAGITADKDLVLQPTDGFVGIGTGTTPPIYNLHIFDGLNAEEQTTISGAGIKIADDSLPRIYWENTGGTNNKKLMAIQYGGDEMTFAALADDGASAINPDVLVIEHDGNIGIGTDDPSAALDVVGEVTASGISGDGTGKAVCIKSDGDLGTCTDAPNASGVCTCS